MFLNGFYSWFSNCFIFPSGLLNIFEEYTTQMLYVDKLIHWIACPLYAHPQQQAYFFHPLLWTVWKFSIINNNVYRHFLSSTPKMTAACDSLAQCIFSFNIHFIYANIQWIIHIWISQCKMYRRETADSVWTGN